MSHKANAVRALAAQFPPDWKRPGDFNPSDSWLESLFDVRCFRTFQIMRKLAAERLEGVETGTAYALPGVDRHGPSRGIREDRFKLDRSEAYAKLWYIDVMIRVYTDPATHEVAA